MLFERNMGVMVDTVRTLVTSEPKGVGMSLNDRELREFEREYAEILCLQDVDAVFRRIVAAVPRLTGLTISSFGDLAEDDRLVLRHTVNASAFDDMVVPAGTGLGGKVLASRQSAWVTDYTTSSAITHHFNRQVLVEDVHGMIVAPVMSGDRLFGVLYGATRAETGFGDQVADTLMTIAGRAAAAAIATERAHRATEVAVAAERHRLALELHDTVGATLFTIGSGIRRLGEDLADNHVASARVRAIGAQAAQASMALRRSLRVLSAPPEQIALSVVLRQDCKAFEERTGVPARLIVLSDVPALREPMIAALTRAAREALLNVEKHAGADSVVVSVYTVPGRVVVAISDDGGGLAAQRPAGLGLAAAGERLNRVGGDLNLSPGDDGGVTVQAWVPIPR
jgi:signal transduction histidine kinase